MLTDPVRRVPLAFTPTPIERLERLGAAYGVDLLVKRDDYTGFGAGGNKVRKLEFLMVEALDHGADVLITTGGHQSNHARVVAAAARRFGMHAVLVLRGDPPDAYQGNLLLDHLFGAELEFLDPDDYFHLVDGRMESHAEAAEAEGKVPYVIPLGGATPKGALGYVQALEEACGQLEATGETPPDVVVAPAGSGGTLAGLHVGCRQLWPDTRILGISVSRDSAWFRERIAPMATECAELIDLGHAWETHDIWIEDRFVGPGYGKPSEGGLAAIRDAARAEGLLLDPVYTGKAMHGLRTMVAEGRIERGARVLFMHCGGSPALYPFASELSSG